MYSVIGGVGVRGGLSVGVVVDESNFRIRRMEARTTTRVGPLNPISSEHLSGSQLLMHRA
jgi:hypothetical protein